MKAKIVFSLLTFISTAAFGAESTSEPQISTNATPSTDSHFDSLSQRQPELSIFVMLVTKAELKDLFNGTGPFTVFAPTDDAFKKLGQKKMDELMKPENRDELSTILIYHVIPGKYMSKSLKTKEAPTINGKTIHIEVTEDGIKVNNAKVIKTDIIGPNGVIDEIDTVLIP